MEHFVEVTIYNYIDTKAAYTMCKKIPLPLQRSFFVVLQNYEKRLKNPFGTIAIYVYLLLYVLILLKSTHDVLSIQTEFICVSLVSKLANESTIKNHYGGKLVLNLMQKECTNYLIIHLAFLATLKNYFELHLDNLICVGKKASESKQDSM